MGKGHGVRFVAHANARELVLASIVESIPNDALNAFARVDVFLNRNFVGRVFFEEAADANVKAFGVFAKHDKPDVVR